METHLDRQDEIVTVSFTTVGIKQLDASIAGLEILPET